MQLTRHDGCHLHVFSPLYRNASNRYLVAFNTRKPVWAHLKSLRMDGYVWYSNSLFLIQVHGKISVNSFFCLSTSSRQHTAQIRTGSPLPAAAVLFSSGFVSPLFFGQIISSALNIILSEFPFVCGFLLLHLQMPTEAPYPVICFHFLECRQYLLSFFTTVSHNGHHFPSPMSRRSTFPDLTDSNNAIYLPTEWTIVKAVIFLAEQLIPKSQRHKNVWVAHKFCSPHTSRTDVDKIM